MTDATPAKASAVRQRFDAAHETAHLILHSNVDPKRLNSAADYKIMEDQAHILQAPFSCQPMNFRTTFGLPLYTVCWE
jgi:hypothetical protein